MRTTRKKAHATVTKGGNVKKKYTFFDSLCKFVAKLPNPQEWQIIFFEGYEVVKMDGQAFKTRYLGGNQ